MKKQFSKAFLITGIAVGMVLTSLAPVYASEEEKPKVDPLDQQHEMALTYYESGDYTRALPLTIKAAKDGHAGSQVLLATMYKDGNGVNQSYVDAKVWYEQAAKQDHVLAQFHLGVMYEQGIGGPIDYTHALEWYGAASKHGLNYAQFNLAMMHLKGHGTPSNLTVARQWFEQSCVNGIQMGCDATDLLTGESEVQQGGEASTRAY